MNSNLRTLPTIGTDPDVLKYAEELVAEIKSGKVTGFVMVTQEPLRGAQYVVAGLKDRFHVTGFIWHMMHCLQSN